MRALVLLALAAAAAAGADSDSEVTVNVGTDDEERAVKDAAKLRAVHAQLQQGARPVAVGNTFWISM